MGTKIKINRKEAEAADDTRSKNNVLQRPLNNNDDLFEPDFYNGLIREVTVEKYEDQYSPDNELRDVVVFDIEIWNEEDRNKDLKFYCNYSFHTKSKLFLNLNNLDFLPEPGEELKLSDLENLQIKARVSIKNDGEFNRIDEIYLNDTVE